MIHDLEVQAMQVRHLARDMDGEDLPLPFVCRFRANRKAFEDQAALGWPVSFPHKRRTAFNVFDLHGQCFDRGEVFFTELCLSTQPSNKERFHGGLPARDAIRLKPRGLLAATVWS